MCSVLQVSPSAYRRHAARLRDRSRQSACAIRDEALIVQIRPVWQENYEVYGVRKIWRQMLRERQTVARCTEERVMRDMGLRGVTRGKAVKTTHADPSNANPRDLVKRQFTADRPQPALGGRFHLRFNLAGVCVRRFHRGCLLPVYRWLACRSAHAHGVCPRCARTSTSQPSA